MIINNLNLFRLSLNPLKNYPPLIINPDAGKSIKITT